MSSHTIQQSDLSCRQATTSAEPQAYGKLNISAHRQGIYIGREISGSGPLAAEANPSKEGLGVISVRATNIPWKDIQLTSRTTPLVMIGFSESKANVSLQFNILSGKAERVKADEAAAWQAWKLFHIRLASSPQTEWEDDRILNL